MVRFADDAVLVFANEEDARRVAEVLPKRFAKYGLRLHPEKTRLVAFRHKGFKPRDGDRPGTFDFLGFTHYWGRSKRGKPFVQRKTARARLARSLRAIHQWCRFNRHLPVAEQHRMLCRKLMGHYAYYGITGNIETLRRFYLAIPRIWRKWLGRRSHSGRMTWERFRRLCERHPLPAPRVVHSAVRIVARP